MNIKEELLKLKDTKYLEFHSKLCKNVNLIGIRVPILRKYAQILYLKYKNNTDKLLSNIDNEYYEEIMLKGMIISKDKKVSFNKLLERLDSYLPLIDNWACCDIFCGSLKITKKYYNEMFQYIIPLFKSDKTYYLRFAIVMCLDYYIDKEHLQIILPLLNKIKNHDYYVDMAIAWFLATCLIKEYDYTIDYLKENKLDSKVYKMMIQKVRDSYRLTKEQKDFLCSLQIKK